MRRIYRFLTVSFCLFLIFLAGCGPKREGKTIYSVDSSDFKPSVEWLDEYMYRIHFNRNGVEGDNDYIEGYWEDYGVTPIVILYSENSPNDIYIMDHSRKVEDIKSEFFNIYYISGRFLVMPDGMEAKPITNRIHYMDSVYHNSQYRWLFEYGKTDIEVSCNEGKLSVDAIKE